MSCKRVGTTGCFTSADCERAALRAAGPDHNSRPRTIVVLRPHAFAYRGPHLPSGTRFHLSRHGVILRAPVGPSSKPGVAFRRPGWLDRTGGSGSLWSAAPTALASSSVRYPALPGCAVTSENKTAIPSSPLWTVAPCSHQRTWAEKDGAQPYQCPCRAGKRVVLKA
jgi:hypothetical protein